MTTRQLLLVILPILVGCQTSDDVNYWRRAYEAPPPTDWPVVGNWSSGQEQLEIRPDMFVCDGIDNAVEEIGQKYIHLEYPACQYSTVIFWRSVPPYSRLNLHSGPTVYTYYRLE